MSLEEWVVYEVLAAAISLTVGTYFGIVVHMLLVKIFGWVYDPETRTWQ